MFTSISRFMYARARVSLPGNQRGWQSLSQNPINRLSNASPRFFSTHDPQTGFKATPPSELNLEMAEGIQNGNLLIQPE